jgi:hypothetical protein
VHGSLTRARGTYPTHGPLTPRVSAGGEAVRQRSPTSSPGDVHRGSWWHGYGRPCAPPWKCTPECEIADAVEAGDGDRVASLLGAHLQGAHELSRRPR